VLGLEDTLYACVEVVVMEVERELFVVVQNGAEIALDQV
jgi:hypothetical protein